MGLSLNRAEFSLNSLSLANSENLRNHWSMNWVQFQDPFCYPCSCGTMVTNLSLTQEIVGSNALLLISNFLSPNSANSVALFKENSNSSDISFNFSPEFLHGWRTLGTGMCLLTKCLLRTEKVRINKTCIKHNSWLRHFRSDDVIMYIHNDVMTCKMTLWCSNMSCSPN